MDTENQTPQGILEIGGVPVTVLKEKCGTPLYVYDEAMIRSRMQEFASCFQGYGFETQVIYASKAFNCKAIIRLCEEYHLGLDVVSGGELYTAMQADFPMSQVYMHGNNKSGQEIQMCLEAGVGTIILDNEMEAQTLAAMAGRFPHEKVHVLLRVNPGIDAHTHKYIQTAYVDSKFGISILRMKEIESIVKTIQEIDNLEFMGFHAHIGSQIFEKKSFQAEIETMMRFLKEFRDRTGFEAKWLDLGGGFAARYTDADAPIPVQEVCTVILETCRKEADACGLQLEKVMIEPGRSIVAEAGYQLYTVGFLKQTQNRKYVFVDGGMADNIRPALYQSEYDFDVATNMNAPKSETVTIAGKCCESGDLLGSDVCLQPCRTGDLLVSHTTGAYGYSMSSNYNKLPTPGVVFVDNGTIRWVIRPQTFADLISRETDETVL